MSGFTEDRFLGGRIALRQSGTGFRSGLDAVMLAASVPAAPGEEALELGSGAGAASLCLAARTGCCVTGLEYDAALAALANENAAANEMDRVRFVQGDVFAPPPKAKRDFAHVFSNPPFHGAAGEAPPDEARARALHDAGRLGDWLAAGLKRTASGGSFTAILRADRMGEALAALPAAGITVFPLWPRAGEAAKRVIIRVRKESRAPLALAAGLVLHEADGRYTPAADAVLRDAQPLEM